MTIGSIGVAEARRRGLEISVKYGLFRVKRTLKDEARRQKIERALKKFVERIEKDGWELQANPTARRIRHSDDSKLVPVPDIGHKMTLLRPTNTAMRSDHPWMAQKDADEELYEAVAWFARIPRTVKLEIPDHLLTRLINSGKLPTSIKLAE